MEKTYLLIKINFSYMQAHDWEADNMAQVDGTEADINNPGGYECDKQIWR